MLIPIHLQETNVIRVPKSEMDGRPTVIRLDGGASEKDIQQLPPASSKNETSKVEWGRFLQFLKHQSEPIESSIESAVPLPRNESPWKKFARTTTGHGFSRMVDRDEPLLLRIFWVLVVILLSIGLFAAIFILTYEALVLQGLQREFIVQHNDTMLLPDIHICDTSLFNRTILQGLGFNKTMGSYLALTLSPMLASRSLKKNIALRKRLEHDFNRLMEGRTIQQVYEKATLKCENIILGCTHDVMTYDSKECCRVVFGRRSHVTDLATMCVSTSKQPPLEEIFASQVYGLTVYLKTNTRDRFEFDPTIISSNVASRRGLLYAVSDPITAVNPIISASGHYMAPGKWAGVSISFTRTDNTELLSGLLSPYSCVPVGSTDYLHLVPSYDVYSQKNCIFASARMVLERKFNCTIFRFHKTSRNVTACEPDVMIDAYSTTLAQKIKQQSSVCPIDCIVNDYHLYSTPSQLNLGEQDEFLSDGEQSNDVVHSAIHLFYPSFSFTIIKNHPQSLLKWLSDVGSNMSLYMGASLLTLLEFIVLIFRCFKYLLRKRRLTRSRSFTETIDTFGRDTICDSTRPLIH